MLVKLHYPIYFTVGMFDSDSILQKIDFFGRRIGIFNRFFAIRFLLEPINRNCNGRFGILKRMTFFFRNPIFHKCEYAILKPQQCILLNLFIIPIRRLPRSTGNRTSAYVPIFITVFSKKCYGFSVFLKVCWKNRIKMFLKITINIYNGFFKKIIRSFCIFYEVF